MKILAKNTNKNSDRLLSYILLIQSKINIYPVDKFEILVCTSCRFVVQLPEISGKSKFKKQAF